MHRPSSASSVPDRNSSSGTHHVWGFGLHGKYKGWIWLWPTIDMKVGPRIGSSWIHCQQVAERWMRHHLRHCVLWASPFRNAFPLSTKTSLICLSSTICFNVPDAVRFQWSSEDEYQFSRAYVLRPRRTWQESRKMREMGAVDVER